MCGFDPIPGLERLEVSLADSQMVFLPNIRPRKAVGVGSKTWEYKLF